MCVHAWVPALFIVLTTATAKSVEHVVGGFNESSSSVVPWQAAFLFNGKLHCSGALIRHNIILTAAHCNLNTSYSIFLPHTNRLLPFSILSVHPHPNYTMNNRGIPVDDVALVEFNDQSITSHNKSIYPNLIPLPGLLVPRQSVLLSGFGTTNARQSIENRLPKLRSVRLPITDNRTCSIKYRISMQNSICAGAKGLGTCLGDSGAPLYTTASLIPRPLASSATLIPTLLGISSFGVGCGVNNFPDVYVRVSAYVPWINTVLEFPPTPRFDPTTISILTSLLPNITPRQFCRPCTK